MIPKEENKNSVPDPTIYLRQKVKCTKIVKGSFFFLFFLAALTSNFLGLKTKIRNKAFIHNVKTLVEKTHHEETTFHSTGIKTTLRPFLEDMEPYFTEKGIKISYSVEPIEKSQLIKETQIIQTMKEFHIKDSSGEASYQSVVEAVEYSRTDASDQELMDSDDPHLGRLQFRQEELKNEPSIMIPIKKGEEIKKGLKRNMKERPEAELNHLVLEQNQDLKIDKQDLKKYIEDLKKENEDLKRKHWDLKRKQEKIIDVLLVQMKDKKDPLFHELLEIFLGK